MLNQAGRAATKKMKLLDSVVTHLNKYVQALCFIKLWVELFSYYFI